jgi:hypothetical protein
MYSKRGPAGCTDVADLSATRYERTAFGSVAVDLIPPSLNLGIVADGRAIGQARASVRLIQLKADILDSDSPLLVGIMAVAKDQIEWAFVVAVNASRKIGQGHCGLL